MGPAGGPDPLGGLPSRMTGRPEIRQIALNHGGCLQIQAMSAISAWTRRGLWDTRYGSEGPLRVEEFSLSLRNLFPSLLDIDVGVLRLGRLIRRAEVHR